MEHVIEKFGFDSTNLKASDFAEPDQIIQLGVAPNRIDILTGLTALNFEAAWEKSRSGTRRHLPAHSRSRIFTV